MPRTQIEAACQQMKFARNYTKQFVDDLAPEDWFWTPSEFTTHIAWQVAHIACSQYALCLQRVRGRTVADETLIPEDFWNQFKIGTTPVTDADANPTVITIQSVFNSVHDQALKELSQKTDEELSVPPEKPHPVFDTLLGAVEYSAYHEMLHTGQIALLRRLMGKPFKR